MLEHADTRVGLGRITMEYHGISRIDSISISFYHSVYVYTITIALYAVYCIL